MLHKMSDDQVYCVAGCCIMLQHVAVCCSVLRCADILVNNAEFTWDRMLHKMSDDQVYCVAACCSMLQHVAVCCSMQIY